MINQQRAKSNKLCVQVSSFPFSIVVFFHSYLWTFKFVTRIFRESCCFLWFHLLFCAGNWRTAGKKLIPLRVPGMARRVKTTCWEGKHFAFLVSCCILLARRFNRPHYEPNTGAMHLNSQTQNTSFLQGCQKNLALSLSPSQSSHQMSPIWVLNHFEVEQKKVLFDQLLVGNDMSLWEHQTFNAWFFSFRIFYWRVERFSERKDFHYSLYGYKNYI